MSIQIIDFVSCVRLIIDISSMAVDVTSLGLTVHCTSGTAKHSCNSVKTNNIIDNYYKCPEFQWILTMRNMILMSYRVSHNYCPVRCSNSNELIGQQLWDTLYFGQQKQRFYLITRYCVVIFFINNKWSTSG